MSIQKWFDQLSGVHSTRKLVEIHNNSCLKSVAFSGSCLKSVAFSDSCLKSVAFSGSCLKSVTFSNSCLKSVAFSDNIENVLSCVALN